MDGDVGSDEDGKDSEPAAKGEDGGGGGREEEEDAALPAFKTVKESECVAKTRLSSSSSTKYRHGGLVAKASAS